MVRLVDTRPTPGELRRFHFPPFTRDRLANGMQVIACDVPGRALGSAILILESGAIHEPKGKEGLAALVARALTEGTTTRDAITFAESVEGLGADLSTRSGPETITMSARVPMSRMGSLLELVADAAQRPAFAEADVMRLRAERVNVLRQMSANPLQRAMWSFVGMAYQPDSRYATPTDGTVASVDALSRDDVADFYRTFATPGSASLIVAGSLGDLDVFATAEEFFAGWTAPEPERRRPDASGAIEKTTVRIVDRPGSVQSNFVLGHVAIARSAPDYHACELLMHALGGSFNCRINQKLREEKGYTYGARASFEPRRDPGPFAAYAPVETSVTADAIADTIAEIRGIVDGGANLDEVDAAREYLTGIAALRFETPDAIAAGLSEIVIYDLSDDYFDTLAQELRAVSVDDVSAAARAHLRPDALAISIVGDASAIADAVGSKGLGTIDVVADSV